MNSYDKLRPWTEIEVCHCEAFTGLFLIDQLTDNPIHCMDCKNEIDPERLGLDHRLVEDIASWFGVWSALYLLWLDSGEYETSAKVALLDRAGQVNIQGVDVAKRLCEYYPTYYLWFRDMEGSEPENCPNCDVSLDFDVKFGVGKCDRCRVIV